MKSVFKDCINCGVEMETKSPLKIYCSLKCKKKYQQLGSNVCVICTKFFPYKPGKKHCSFRCKAKKWKTRECKQCGIGFYTTHRLQAYCDDHRGRKVATYTTKECESCGTEFQANKNNSKFCTRTCKEKVWDKKKEEIRIKKREEAGFKKETEFSKNIHKYEDRLVEYKTPTGRAYAGFVKLPLMENDNGIGFKGVLLQSENRNLIQCSECGQWVKQITPSHLKKHGMSLEDYKVKFGINLGAGLVSDTRGVELADQCNKNVNLHMNTPHFEKIRKKLKKANSDLTKSGKRSQIKNTMQQYNRWGTCPEQLKAGVVEYIHRMKRLPTTQATHRGGFSKSKTLISRFGSLNEAFKSYGLPIRHKHGSNTEYIFHDGTSCWVKKGEGYNKVYALLLEKCPILHEFY